MSLKSNWMRNDVAPRKTRQGVTNGALTRAERIRSLNRQKFLRERRGIAAEIIGDERRKIEQAKEHRKNVKATRKAVDQAAEATLAEMPKAQLKIVRGKNGLSLRVRDGGKFKPSVQIDIAA